MRLRFHVLGWAVLAATGCGDDESGITGSGGGAGTQAATSVSGAGTSGATAPSASTSTTGDGGGAASSSDGTGAAGTGATTGSGGSGSGGAEACTEVLLELDVSVGRFAAVGETLFLSRSFEVDSGDTITVEAFALDGGSEPEVLATGTEIIATATDESSFFWIDYPEGSAAVHRTDEDTGDDTIISDIAANLMAAGSGYVALAFEVGGFGTVESIPRDGGDPLTLGTLDGVEEPGPLVLVGTEAMWATTTSEGGYRILQGDVESPLSLAVGAEGAGAIEALASNDQAAFGMVNDGNGALSLWRFDVDGTSEKLLGGIL